MKSVKSNSILVVLSATALLSCRSYEYSSQKNDEKVNVKVLNYEKPVTLSRAISLSSPDSVTRGFITTELLAQGAGLAVQGVKKLIKESRKNYTQKYQGALMNDFFYSKTSLIGIMDPQYIQFRGFEITRYFKDAKSNLLTAAYVRLVIDEKRLNEAYQNSKFYLKVDSISITHSRVKINKSSKLLPWTWFIKNKKSINLDFDIHFNAGWIGSDGSIIENREMGSFYLNLRDVPIGPASSNREYFEKLKGQSLDGFSYIIPRGSAFCRNKDGEYQACYGRGQFNVLINATESSKEGTVNKIIIDNADHLGQIKDKDLQMLFQNLNKKSKP